MNTHTQILTLATLMLAATTAFGQGAAPGGGSNGSGAGSAGSQGQGAVANDAATPGWNAMSAEERSAHRQRMQSFRNYNDCNRYIAQMRSRSGGAAAADPGSATGGPSRTGPSAGPAVGGNDPCGHLPRS